jgi:NOL1/NOP2/sun family putative RNA methylase
MAKKLPQPFIDKMKLLLGSEFDAFLGSYDETRNYGLRVNPLKISPALFQASSPFQLNTVPWAAEGFYYGWGDRPGKHPYYHAGLYYIQEPSAMAPAELLQVEPGDRVLDLCAAPGGKSTQIAGKLMGQGLLVSNDNQAERVKALVKNLSIFGIRNAVVTNETPDKLVHPFANYFNKIVIDAPCSGEGMFRKDEAMISSWESHSIQKCSAMQKEILDTAAKLLAPGGRIVYSTCTFAPEENEATIARFLDNHPEFGLQSTELGAIFEPGHPDWINGERYATEELFSTRAIEAVEHTYRLWPHRIKGEGHFIAILQHMGHVSDDAEAHAARQLEQMESDQPDALHERKTSLPVKNKRSSRKSGEGHSHDRQEKKNDISLWFNFMESNLTERFHGSWTLYGDRIYLSDPLLPDLTGVNVARPGWYVGTLKKNRFEPSQALALGLRLESAVRRIRFDLQDPDLLRYLKGETLQLAEDKLEKSSADVPSKGYCLIGVDGFPLGWGKWMDGMLKNEYPPGWRWT